MIHIVGEDIIEQAQAFRDVRDALDFDEDVYLGAMWANPLGIELKDVGIYNMEPLHDKAPVFKMGYMDTLRNCFVIDYSMKNVEYLRKHGIEAVYMPYGIHDGLKRVKQAKKDIDFLFIGSAHFERRQKFFDKMGDRLVIANGVYGEDLDKLVARTRVHINVHHYDEQQLEVVRLNYLLANGCNVVSERGCESEVNGRYEDSVWFGDYDWLPDLCEHALAGSKGQIPCIKQDCSMANKWLNWRITCLQ